ncbi:DNA-binding protein [Paenibacillus peoriae]|uniref:DNA-binding protein n=1 Tax=Paenibacillus TaxID=44249 RepID=UPI0020248A67|nr:DNA-binding protein [Paenibacillus polymyxa]MDY7991494.1 DNA-binding protein [Paenibacillus polymyxa]MDY8117935.1 DNA-binding protein [Paenibacillus polymyxa]WGV32960.1 DNA-binding protein [Paenibacillus polymyxa]
MENATTIRSEIEKELKLGGYTFNSFGQATGLNRGIFSAMLNGNPPKPISVRQMDLITKAFNYPEGWLYDLYVDECFYDGRPHWKRVKPFLIRCVEVGNLRCVEKVLSRLMEDLNHIPTIFALAEELYDEGKLQEAIPFYECVVENEKYQHSERLAISHYKIFSISVSENLETNLEAVLRFIPFRNRLPVDYQLDGLLKMANIYFYLHQWKEAERYADELRNITSTVLSLKIYKGRKRLNTDRHLVVYYGQGYLIKSAALEKQGFFEEAMGYIRYYEDLSWFEDLDEVGEEEVQKFKVWAEANKLNLYILMGDVNRLHLYEDFLKKNPPEIIPGLLTIVESANINGFSINDTLLKFSQEIEGCDDVSSMHGNYYPESSSLDTCANLFYQIAVYYFNHSNYVVAINYVLRSLRIYLKINDKPNFVQGTALFEKYRHAATSVQKIEYQFIMEEVLNNAQKSNVHRVVYRT